MILSLMLVALGFLTASLIAFLIAPLIWRRAASVTARRLQKRIPTSLVEAQAERDQLRAEHALAIRKLELKVDDLKEKLTAQAVELTRANRRIGELVAEAEKREAQYAEREAEIDTLTRNVEALEKEVAARAERIAALETTLAARNQAIEAAQRTIRERDLEIEKLKGHLATQDAAEAAAAAPVHDTQKQLADRLRRLSRLVREIEQSRAEMTALQAEIDDITGRLAGAGSLPAAQAEAARSRLEALEADRGRVTVRIHEAQDEAGKLRSEIDLLDKSWQSQIGPLKALSDQIETAAGQPAADGTSPDRANGRGLVALFSGRNSQPDVAADDDATPSRQPKKRPMSARMQSLAERIRALQNETAS